MAGNWGVCTVCSPPSAQFGSAARLEKGPVHFSPHPSNRVGHPALYQCTGPDCEWGCHVPPCTAFSEPANLHINRKAASSFQHLLEFFADLPAPWVPLGNLPWTWKKEVMRRTALALLGQGNPSPGSDGRSGLWTDLLFPAGNSRLFVPSYGVCFF